MKNIFKEVFDTLKNWFNEMRLFFVRLITTKKEKETYNRGNIKINKSPIIETGTMNIRRLRSTVKLYRGDFDIGISKNRRDLIFNSIRNEIVKNITIEDITFKTEENEFGEVTVLGDLAIVGGGRD